MNDSKRSHANKKNIERSNRVE
ncbi:Protein of unknown function [Bacillus toyonensis]|nr:Protein of unknown function [Bacillus toyonensis]